MKNFFKLIPFFIFLLIALPARAQERTFSDELKKSLSPATRAADVKQKIEQKRDELVSNRATISAKFTEEKRGIIKAYFDQMDRRMREAIDQLDKIAKRIESRITKIEASDTDKKIDLTNSKNELAEARSELASASAALVQAETSFESTLASEKPKESFIAVKESIRNVKTQLIETRGLLIKIIGEIKGLHLGEGVND